MTLKFGGSSGVPLRQPPLSSVALFQLERIKGLPFANSPAHQLAIKYRIRRGLDEK